MLKKKFRKVVKNRTSIKPPEIEEDENDEVMRQKLLKNMKLQSRRQTAEFTGKRILSPERTNSPTNNLSNWISQLDSAYKRRDSYVQRQRELQELLTLCDRDLDQTNETIHKLIGTIFDNLQNVAKQQKKQQINQNIQDELKKISSPGKNKKINNSRISRLPIPTRKRKSLSTIRDDRKIARIVDEEEDLDLRELIPSKAIGIVGQLPAITQVQQLIPILINPFVEVSQQNQVQQINESVKESESLEIINNNNQNNIHHEQRIFSNKNSENKSILLEEGEICESDDENILTERNVNKIKENSLNIENILQAKKLKEKQALLEIENSIQIVPQSSNNFEQVEKIKDKGTSLFLPLLSIRSYRLSPNFPHHLLAHPAFSCHLNPFIPLCPFQLNGLCADKKCIFQHEQDYIQSDKQIVEEFLSYWPKLVPKGTKKSDYATKMLEEGPLDQVLGFLMAKMPEDVRICLDLFSNKYSQETDKQLFKDDKIDYEPIIQSVVGQPKE
ncbi:C3H1-type domain-containing protein [Meloidogyne graminicola]|uniref:C3H1-type domain-containing protein n=1 Tax=Meloidogyne graminicola TaxID=189291 RepID=A0A8S9ZB55_9BILA|nr:C3H1-type domain-containing protein [Meloidogyne graminicola]